MKKGTKVILGVIIGVLLAYSVIATFAVRETMKELEHKTTDYEIMKENYLEVQKKNIELEFEKAVK